MTDDIHRCPICQVAFQPDDTCADDIELGTCHAACLEGSPVVDLETGDELPDGKIDSYPYSEVMDAKPETHADSFRAGFELSRAVAYDNWRNAYAHWAGTPAPETRMRGPHAGPPVRAVHGLSETSGATALDARPEIGNSRLMSGAVAVLYPSPQSNVVAEQSGIAVLDCTRLSRTEREQEQNPSIEMTLLQSGGVNAEKIESEDQHSNTKDQRNRGFHEDTVLTVSSVKSQDHPNVPATALVPRVEA